MIHSVNVLIAYSAIFRDLTLDFDAEYLKKAIPRFEWKEQSIDIHNRNYLEFEVKYKNIIPYLDELAKKYKLKLYNVNYINSEIERITYVPDVFDNLITMTASAELEEVNSIIRTMTIEQLVKANDRFLDKLLLDFCLYIASVGYNPILDLVEFRYNNETSQYDFIHYRR